MEKIARNDVQLIIDEINKTHRYSMSKIYTAFNNIFGTTETPQACASCLIRKKKDLESWLNDDTYIPAYLKHINKI